MIGFKPLKSLHFGDIFEVQTAQGFFYIQYCNFDALLGYLLRKLEGKFTSQQTDINKLSDLKTEYYFFYPLDGAVKQKCVKLFGHRDLHPQDRKMPVMINPISEAVRGGRDKARLWEIIEPNGRIYKVTKLNEDQKNISIWSIVTHTGLIVYLNNDWTPYKANTNYELTGTTWMKPEIL